MEKKKSICRFHSFFSYICSLAGATELEVGAHTANLIGQQHLKKEKSDECLSRRSSTDSSVASSMLLLQPQVSAMPPFHCRIPRKTENMSKHSNSFNDI
jgi:hypothetical protein